MVCALISSFSCYILIRTGVELDLPPEAEEVAGFYEAMIETDHAQDATFNKNFFEDWKRVLAKHPPVSAVDAFVLGGPELTSF